MTTQMLYAAMVEDKIIYIGKCERTLEAWQMEAEKLHASLHKTPAMKPLRLLELICKDDEELEQARKVLVFTLKPIGNWNEWSQFEEDWTHVSYWREAEPKEMLENYVREKMKEQEEQSKLSEVEVLKGMV